MTSEFPQNCCTSCFTVSYFDKPNTILFYSFLHLTSETICGSLSSRSFSRTDCCPPLLLLSTSGWQRGRPEVWKRLCVNTPCQSSGAYGVSSQRATSAPHPLSSHSASSSSSVWDLLTTLLNSILQWQTDGQTDGHIQPCFIRIPVRAELMMNWRHSV